MSIRAWIEAYHEGETGATAPPVKPATPVEDPKLKEYKKGLRFCGYDPGKIDGFMTDETRSAIKKFQQDMKVSVTGVMDGPSQKAMTDAIKKVMAAQAELAKTKALIEKGKAEAAKKEAEDKAERAKWAGVGGTANVGTTGGVLGAIDSTVETVGAVISTPTRMVVGGLSKAQDKLDDGVDVVVEKVLPEDAADVVNGARKFVKGARHTSQEMLKGMGDPRSQKQTLDNMAKAYVKGEKEGGTVNGVKDAINTVNPIYDGMVQAVETYRSIRDGHYEEAGEHATHVVNDVMAVVGIAEGVGAIGSGMRGGPVGAGGPRGTTPTEVPGPKPPAKPPGEPAPPPQKALPAGPKPISNEPMTVETARGPKQMTGAEALEQQRLAERYVQKRMAAKGNRLKYPEVIEEARKQYDVDKKWTVPADSATSQRVTIQTPHGPQEMTVAEYRNRVQKADAWLDETKRNMAEKGQAYDEQKLQHQAAERFELDANWHSIKNENYHPPRRAERAPDPWENARPAQGGPPPTPPQGGPPPGSPPSAGPPTPSKPPTPPGKAETAPGRAVKGKPPKKGQVTAANVNKVPGMQKFLTELDKRGLTLNELNVTPEQVIEMLDKDPVAGMKDLNHRVEIAIEHKSRQLGNPAKGPRVGDEAKIDYSHEVAPAEKKWYREDVMGDTPQKDSPTGRKVIARMRSQGKIQMRGEPAREMVWHEGSQNWYPIEECDMGHTHDAVAYWNKEGKFHGPRSEEVRTFQNEANNYELEPRSINRSRGAELGERYEPPNPHPITDEEMAAIREHNKKLQEKGKAQLEALEKVVEDKAREVYNELLKDDKPPPKR